MYHEEADPASLPIGRWTPRDSIENAERAQFPFFVRLASELRIASRFLTFGISRSLRGPRMHSEFYFTLAKIAQEKEER